MGVIVGSLMAMSSSTWVPSAGCQIVQVGWPAMDNRDTTLCARFPPDAQERPFLELDLREFFAGPLLGRRGQLQVTTKLAFKAADAYRKDQSVFWLWADVQVMTGPNNLPLPSLGRAVLPEPVFFRSDDEGTGTNHDPWTRSTDRLVLDLDHRQLDEIERHRKGSSLTFTFTAGGIVQHGGQVARLYPNPYALTYEVGASKWVELLTQLGYGTYLTFEVPLTPADGLTGEVRHAAEALQEALAAFRRGDYEEAVADCRPGLDAIREVDKDRFSLKPWDQNASRAERFYWIERSLLSVTHLAHHPNDRAAADDVDAAEPTRPTRTDAEAVIAMLATLIRHRTDRS